MAAVEASKEKRGLDALFNGEDGDYDLKKTLIENRKVLEGTLK